MRIVTITLAATLAMLAISPRQDADAAIDAQSAAVAINANRSLMFDPDAKAFPALLHFASFEASVARFESFAAVSPLVRVSLPSLVDLPSMKPLDLAPLDLTPAAPAKSEAPKAKKQAMLSREDLGAAYVMPGETDILQEEPAKPDVQPAEPMVEIPALPQRRPREADRAPAAPEPGRIVFASFTLPPMGHTLFCLKYPADCRVQATMPDAGPITLTDKRRAELVRINAEVNSAIKPMNVPGVIEDKWLISPKRGDCNDYAVTKRHKLLALGWPSRDLLLAEVVTTWGVHHLVLVVRTDKGDLVADSLHKGIHNWAETPYRWVRVETPKNPKFWASIQTPEPRLVAMAKSDSQL